MFLVDIPFCLDKSCVVSFWVTVPFCADRLQEGKTLPVIDSVDLAGMSDAEDLPKASPAAEKTKSGRDSYKNELTKRFGSKYRDADNTKTLMGEQMPLGKAYGIIAGCMFGPGLPTEQHRHVKQLDIWKNAAKYALNIDSITTVLEWPDAKDQIVYFYFNHLN